MRPPSDSNTTGKLLCQPILPAVSRLSFSFAFLVIAGVACAQGPSMNRSRFLLALAASAALVLAPNVLAGSVDGGEPKSVLATVDLFEPPHLEFAAESALRTREASAAAV